MILAILQARMSSTRFPGKVLKQINGKAMLAHQIARVQLSKKIDGLVVATSTMADDNAIEALCTQLNVTCFRGDLENVLSRFYWAASAYEPSHVVRLTGDCPLIDSNIIDAVIDAHIAHSADYTSNTIQPTFPDGLDVEVMTWDALKRAYLKAKLSSETEHVTPYLIKNPGLFKLHSCTHSTDLSHMRWTVDEIEDFELIAKIYENLSEKAPYFTMESILSFLAQNPHLSQINAKFERNAGMKTSLEKDKIYLNEKV